MRQSWDSFTEHFTVIKDGEEHPQSGRTLTVGKTYSVTAYNSEGGTSLYFVSKLVSIIEDHEDPEYPSELDYEFVFENGVQMDELMELSIEEELHP